MQNKEMGNNFPSHGNNSKHQEHAEREKNDKSKQKVQTPAQYRKDVLEEKPKAKVVLGNLNDPTKQTFTNNCRNQGQDPRMHLNNRDMTEQNCSTKYQSNSTNSNAQTKGHVSSFGVTNKLQNEPQQIEGRQELMISPSKSLTNQMSVMNNPTNDDQIVTELVGVDMKLESILAESTAQARHAFKNRKIAATQKVPEYNILLLGESGAGKSTTINAFANYVKYGTFESAASVPNFAELISSKFMLTDPETGDEFPICSGSDTNECHTSAGVSSTQSPMAYQFLYRDKLVRIIDTPGMGDTRGLLVDKQNFDRILQYLKHYKELHAICVLIKANESRQVASFRYCITELLSHLHQNACQNIIFCFTFSRNTFYRPGDGFFTLKDFLAEEFPDMKLELRPGENCFFVDNEAYRFQVAKKCHYPFLPEQAKSYKESWDKSSHQTSKMIERILLTLTPHNLEETFELNKARKLILSLVQPMVQLQLNIKGKIQIVTTEMVRFNKSHKSIPDLQNALSALIGNELQMNKLNYPAVVCTSTECTQARQLQDGQNVLQYSARCHSECTEIEIENNSLGHPLLKNCAAIEQDTGKCRSCRCSWKKHMYLTLEYNFVKKHLLGKEKITEIVNERSHAQRIQLLTGAIEKLRSDLICELDSLQIFNAIYGHLLEKCSNTSYSRFTEPYLDVLMEEESKKSAAIPNYKIYAQEACRILNELKHSQAARIDQVRQSIQEGTLPDFDLKNVNSLCDDLYKLNLSGPKLRHLIQAFNSAEQNQQCEHIERIGLTLTEQ